MEPLYPKERIVHIRNVDHPESIAVGPDGTAYTTGTGCQVYRLDLETNTAVQYARTPGRCLGQAVDADGNLYAGHAGGGEVLRIDPQGRVREYARGPGGRPLVCANYPAFDAEGCLYLSESGDWSGQVNGHILRIRPGGGEAELWYPAPVDTPNGIALDAAGEFLYFVETLGAGIARIRIRADGSAGACERVLHLPRHVPDGIAFDAAGRLWLACHRPDAIYLFDLASRRLQLFVEDWAGEHLRGPTDVAFAGPQRDILLAASLDNLVVHRLDGCGARGLPLHHPRLPC